VPDEFKADLHSWLKEHREALLWKLDGVSEYDVRRPMTPTGTNLLGLVKHIAAVAAGYFSFVFDRPFGEPLPWYEPDVDPTADLWAAADESRAQIVELWHKAWAHADATIEALPLDAPGQVPWWTEGQREVTLHRILVHMLAETARHAGHADILRELIDGRGGADHDDAGDAAFWAGYVEGVQQAAERYRS
jgi:hypothetical protein